MKKLKKLLSVVIILAVCGLSFRLIYYYCNRMEIVMTDCLFIKQEAVEELSAGDFYCGFTEAKGLKEHPENYRFVLVNGVMKNEHNIAYYCWKYYCTRLSDTFGIRMLKMEPTYTSSRNIQPDVSYEGISFKCLIKCEADTTEDEIIEYLKNGCKFYGAGKPLIEWFSA